MSGNFCPGCGGSTHAEDDFCRQCGRRLSPPVPHPVTNGAGHTSGATLTAETATLPRLDAATDAPPAEAPRSPDAAPEAPVAQATRRRRILLGSGGAAVVVVAAVGGWLVFGRDDSQDRARQALAPVPGAAAPALRSADAAKRLVEVQLAGRLAAKATERVTIQSGAAQAIGDERHRTVASNALSAERRLIGDLAKLATINEDSLAQWPTLKQALQEDTLSLRQAATAVAGLELDRGATLVISADAADHAIRTVDGVLAHADSALRQWQAQTRSQRSRNRSSLNELDSYVATVRGHLASYDRLRDETSNWVAKVDRDGATFTEAYQVLGDMAESRQNIKDAIAAIDAPPAVAAAQNRLVLVLGNAVQAMHDATSGISDYQFNQDDYGFDYKQSPGWQEFERSSAQISSDYAAARAGWEQRVEQRRRSTRNRDLPPMPAV